MQAGQLSGWVMMTAENDFGEMEDYLVLCRRCNKIARE